MPDQSHRPQQVVSNHGSSGGTAQDDSLQGTLGNGATQDLVSGAFGRVFNRMLGVDVSRTDTGNLEVDGAMLRRYLDQDLQLAEGEWFRGKKLDGVRDALIEQLDTDGDGMLSWSEFANFEAQTLALMAPGAEGGATPDQVAQAASRQFAALDTGRGSQGSLTYDELSSGTKDALPAGTEHIDLVAQLGARVALDAADTDQRRSNVKERELSVAEWTAVAREMAARNRS